MKLQNSQEKLSNRFELFRTSLQMKLAGHIISKPRFLGFIPFIGNKTANSIGPFIFVPLDIYNDLKSQNPHPRHLALLIHEETHRKRQKEMGFIRFGVQYVFNSRFRFKEELIAVKEAMKFLKKNKLSFEFDKHAKFLSNYVYLWPVSKDYAQKELKKVWNEI